jgi:hypothetical protein
MKRNIMKYLLVLGIAAAVWAWDGGIRPMHDGNVIATAEAIIGRPLTPVSYAGVARRTTVRVATPGVGAPGVGAPGVGAPGVGVRPFNRGGPVNRVGFR